jgi:hypothetical protein
MYRLHDSIASFANFCSRKASLALRSSVKIFSGFSLLGRESRQRNTKVVLDQFSEIRRSKELGAWSALRNADNRRLNHEIRPFPRPKYGSDRRPGKRQQ